MVSWVHFYRLPPKVYWDLNPDELAAFHRYRDMWDQLQEQQK